MEPKNKKQPYNKEDYKRSSEDVPFFPFSSVMMQREDQDVSSIEEAQNDFVMRAGYPRNDID
ncbi:MAG: hypothetical protein JXA19_06000 [Anaerolineales bacterium]|nr:hypothetical protein [Anaerolineales bacterium]